MTAAWVIPHPQLPWPDGHTTRASVACHAVPGIEIVENESQFSHAWDFVVFDTWAISRWAGAAFRLLERGIPLVSIARALNQPTTELEPEWALILQPGPYERTTGRVIAPLVEVLPAKATTVDVLVVVSRHPQHPWWAQVVHELRTIGADFTVLSGSSVPGCKVVSGLGAEWISKANVVIGGAGGGGLYETLWAGKPLVARAFTVEQHTRLSAAVAAGEAIIQVEERVEGAIAEARAMTTLGIRQNGSSELATVLRGFSG